MALRRPALRPGPPALPRRPRGPRRRRRSRSPPSSPSPLDGDATRPSSSSGPDFLAAPRPSPDGTRLAWLEWDHPDMPWDATRLRVATIAEDGTLGPSDLAAGGPDESIAQPEWSPDGTLHLVSDRSGWWNLYRLVEGPRLEPLAPMEAEFADPAWLFDRSSYAFLPDGSIVAVGASRRPRPASSTSSPASLVGEVATAVHRVRRAARRRGDASSRSPASPTDPPVARRARPGDAGADRRPAPPDDDDARRRRRSPARSRSRSRRPAAATAHALYYPPTNPDVTAPDGRAAAARRPVARRPDRQRVDRARPRQPAADQPRDRRRRRRLRRQHRLRPRRTGSSSTASGASSTSTTASRPRASSSSAATSTPSGWPSRAAAPAATRPSRALAFRDTFAAGHQPVRDRRPRDARPRHPQVRVALHGPARRAVPGDGRAVPRALAGPLPRRDRRARSSSSRASTTRSCRRPRPRRSSPRSRPTASRTPTSRSRARATASAAPPPCGARSRPSSSFLGAVFGFEPADELRRSTLPGLEAWRARRADRRRRADPSACPGRPDRRPTSLESTSARSSSSSSCSSWPSALSYLARGCGSPTRSCCVARRPRPRVPAPACPSTLELEPDLVFLLFLPPILFAAAYFTPIRDFRANAPARSCCWPSASSCSRRSSSGSWPSRSIPDLPPGRRLRPRRHRRPTRRGRRHRHLPAPRRPAPDRHDPRGREPHQRRVGADRLPGRGRPSPSA